MTEHINVVSYKPLLIGDGPSQTTVSDAQGWSRVVAKDGCIELEVRERPLAGKRNEPNVLQVLTGALTDEGHPTWKPGVDANGEDGVLIFSAQRELAVQVVSVPAEEKHWRAVSTGHTRVRITFNEAAAWIHGAIDKKLGIAIGDRANLLLALDARHCGQVTNDAVLTAFQANYKNPASYGFAQIWIVGPVVGRCRRLA